VGRRKQQRERARTLDLAVLEAETARLQVESLRSELQELHHELARRDVEMVSALTHLAHATSSLQLATERDLEDRTRLARAVELLAMFAAVPAVAAPVPQPTVVDAPATPPEPAAASITIIGGSVDPGRTAPPPPSRLPVPPTPDDTGQDDLPPAAHEPTIDLTTELPVAPVTRAEAPLECSVRLKFGDRWIEGFQIEETLNGPDGVKFRLRRRVDGWILPELFDEHEVRVFTRPVVDPVARS
jgi:hypothetical protein